MRFLIAPDSFKESMSADEAASAIRDGIALILPQAEFDLAPLADGGEGTAECLRRAWQGQWVACTVTGPQGKPVETGFVRDAEGQCAVIETAACCGLAMVPPAMRNPMLATSRGVGEMIRAALAAGCRNLVIALGGSATNDGGIGMLQALGAAVLDAAGNPAPPGAGGLEAVASIDLSPCRTVLEGVTLTILCDVRSPLLGRLGATRLFGGQKGATSEQIETMERGMARYAALLHTVLGNAVANRPGAGAAGGLGCALMALSDLVPLRQRSGADYVMEALDIDRRIRQADIVIVGEGALDAQSLEGKLPIQIARRARRAGRPVVAFAGMENGREDDFRACGIDAVYCLLRRLAPIETTLREGKWNLTRSAQTFAATLAIAERIHGDAEGLFIPRADAARNLVQ